MTQPIAEIPQTPIDQLVSQFIHWEQASRDTIDFKKSYVDMAGDLVAGLVLSQIIYWHLPGRNGVTRLTVSHDGQMWIAKKREEWWDEIRISPKQLDRALKVLEDKGLVVTSVFHYNKIPIKHVRLNWNGFIPSFQIILSPKAPDTTDPILPKGENRQVSTLPKGQSPSSPKVKVLLNRDYIQRESFPTTPDGVSVAAPIGETSPPVIAPDPKPAEPPKKPEKPIQPQADLFDGWIASVGKDTLPPGFAYGPYMRFTKKLATEGKTRTDLECAGLLYRDWIDAHPGKMTLNWDAAVVISEIKRALALCADGVTTEDVTRFVRAKKAETDKGGRRFWDGKMVPFEHVANNIGVWLAENPRPLSADPNADNTWFDDDAGIWFRRAGGKLYQRDQSTGDWQEKPHE